MLMWMTTLPGHSYSLREERPPTLQISGLVPDAASPKALATDKHESVEVENHGLGDITPSDNTVSEELDSKQNGN